MRCIQLHIYATGIICACATSVNIFKCEICGIDTTVTSETQHTIIYEASNKRQYQFYNNTITKFKAIQALDDILISIELDVT